jgi:hypothetical protein
MSKKRTHKLSIEKMREARKASPEQIRKEKYQRTKARNAERARERQVVIDERLNHWRSLTPQQQLTELDRRLGKGIGAKKQRARIAEQLSKREKK